MRTIILIAIGISVALIVYVRLAAHNLATVHVAPQIRGVGDYPAMGRFTAVRQITAAPDDVLKVLTQAAMTSGRTQILAGHVDAGLISFVTRTKVVGFPDYTTVSIISAGAEGLDNAGPLLMIHARLRYGKNDFRVNERRVMDWLSALGPLTVPLEQDRPST